MNPRSAHRLADDRHAARYAAAQPTASPAPPAWPASPARLASLAAPIRRRLGLLLVEAGLHLLTSADRPRRRTSLAS